MNLADLTELQIDAIREVGSIGAGHAATALSQLTGRPIDISVPVLELIPFAEVPHVLGGPERLFGAVYVRLLGDVAGGMLFMAERDSALALVDLLHDRPVHTTRSFGRDEERLLTHAATILIGAYLAAIARLTDMDVLPSSSAFALDMAGAILEVATLEANMYAEDAMLVRTTFSNEESTADAALLFLPDPSSLEVILGRLGVV
jgi:chemotaxis protein CheC